MTQIQLNNVFTTGKEPSGLLSPNNFDPFKVELSLFMVAQFYELRELRTGCIFLNHSISVLEHLPLKATMEIRQKRNLRFLWRDEGEDPAPQSSNQILSPSYGRWVESIHLITPNSVSRFIEKSHYKRILSQMQALFTMESRVESCLQCHWLLSFERMGQFLSILVTDCFRLANSYRRLDMIVLFLKAYGIAIRDPLD